jgi:homoserine O-acetyltransferase/O-succinyltransferase
MARLSNSPLGVIEPRFFSFGGLTLDNGQFFGPVTVAYQVYGKLNANRDNAILICHALSGDAHVAGMSAEDGRLGWWENMVGAGKPLDTAKYFLICSNVLGGCKGTTGPSSLNPTTGKPYALTFPVITVNDMVRVQKQLIDYLGIEKLLAVVGGSMGGMQALSWAMQYPEKLKSVIALATCPRLTAQGIALNEIGRRAIMADANWNNGDYYSGNRPAKGLAVARMLGHISYLSDVSMTRKFGRRLRNKAGYSYSFEIDFEVESYLQHQGEVFNTRFDANSYLYITRAMDYFDLTGGTGDLVGAFGCTRADYLFISFASDWLYPPYQSQEMAEATRANNLYTEYVEIQAEMGHDSFLLETAQQGAIMAKFLERASRQ